MFKATIKLASGVEYVKNCRRIEVGVSHIDLGGEIFYRHDGDYASGTTPSRFVSFSLDHGKDDEAEEKPRGIQPANVAAHVAVVHEKRGPGRPRKVTQGADTQEPQEEEVPEVPVAPEEEPNAA